MPDSELESAAKLTEGAAKLIKAVQDAFGATAGTLFREKIAKSKARAAVIETETEAERRIKLAQTEAEVRSIDVQSRLEIWEKLESVRRQQNRDGVMQIAAQEIPDDVSDNMPDEDWTVRFFRECEDIGDEEMQILWGKILAGEVASPGSYSKRTLGIIKDLTRQEAECFRALCRYVWIFGAPVGPTPIILGIAPKFLRKTDISQRDLVSLHNIGLILFNPVTTLALKEQLKLRAAYGDKTFEFERDEKADFDQGHVDFTESGRELFILSGAVVDENYREETLKLWSSKGWECTQLP